MELPLAPQGVFRTIQGEGTYAGTPMTFVRLAGCSVGCPQCDTDYSVAERTSVKDIVERCKALYPPRKQINSPGVSRQVIVEPSCSWVFVTGGEPTDHGDKLSTLIDELRSADFDVAVATSGANEFTFPWSTFISCSPHSTRMMLQRVDEIKLVPGLNGLSFDDCDRIASRVIVKHCRNRFMQPMDGSPIQPCIEWVERHPGWRLSIQTHKVLGLP